MRSLHTCLMVIALAAGPAGAQIPATPAPKPASVPITACVLDSAGKPASGAMVGSFVSRRGPDQPGTGPLAMSLHGAAEAPTTTTDANGCLVIAPEHLFHGETDTRERVLVAMNADATQMGLLRLKRGALGLRTEIRMQPTCRVIVQATSPTLESIGQKLRWSNVYVHIESVRTGPRFLGIESDNGTHELFLPPGEYQIDAYGADTYSMYPWPMLTIAPGEKEKAITVELPATRLARLIGKPAPELTKIKGWKNAAAAGGSDAKGVTLADLKGKVVLLDFWGHWCGPCVAAMPELMELHEKYKEKGLVIIAVHDDSVESIAEMESKLAGTLRDVWKGRDLPFAVALDGGGESPIPDHDDTTHGATTAAYGIQTWPTQVIIGRDGKVVGRRKKGNGDQIPALMER